MLLSNAKHIFISVPKPGTLVNTKIVKRAGPYLLGPALGSSPVRSIVQCLARKEHTDQFYTLKVNTTFHCIQMCYHILHVHKLFFLIFFKADYNILYWLFAYGILFDFV